MDFAWQKYAIELLHLHVAYCGSRKFRFLFCDQSKTEMLFVKPPIVFGEPSYLSIKANLSNWL